MKIRHKEMVNTAVYSDSQYAYYSSEYGAGHSESGVVSGPKLNHTLWALGGVHIFEEVG